MIRNRKALRKEETGNTSKKSSCSFYYYYHFNSQGDVNVVTDSNGNVYRQYFYDPYGNVIKVLEGAGATVDINNDSGFNHAYTYRGYRYDQESGLYFLNARYYAAGIGRFITKDTFKGVATDPRSLNRYGYCAGDPVNQVDPSGHCHEDLYGQMLLDARTQEEQDEVYALHAKYDAEANAPETPSAETVISNVANYGSSIASTVLGMVSANEAKASNVVLSNKAWNYSLGAVGIGWAVTSAFILKDPANAGHLPAILGVHTLMTGVAFVGGALALGFIGTLALPAVGALALGNGVTVGNGMLSGTIENAWIKRIRK